MRATEGHRGAGWAGPVVEASAAPSGRDMAKGVSTPLPPAALGWQGGGLGRGTQGSSRDKPLCSRWVLASPEQDAGGWGL